MDLWGSITANKTAKIQTARTIDILLILSRIFLSNKLFLSFLAQVVNVRL